MERSTESKLTIYFDEPFWVGVFEEFDGIVGMNTGIFNNPFISWGKYRYRDLQYELPISFQFHHTQLDGSHAGRFPENLQKEINVLLMRG